jgi:hypothetical protein
MEIIAQLGSIFGLSFISGINLYATVAVVGISTRYGLVQGLPPEFNVLANDVVIFVALFLYILEFFADKIPGLDTLWDSIHTIIRPLGGAMLALIQVGEASPAMEVVVFMLGASLASAAHVTKAGTRLIVNTSPEPFSNVLLSLVEDAGAIGFSYLSLAYPKTSFFLTLAFLTIIGFLFPLIMRTIRMLFSAIFFRIKYLFVKETHFGASHLLPYAYDAIFDQQRDEDENPIWSGKAYAVKISRVPKFSTLHVVVTSKATHVFFKRWFKIQSLVLPVEEIKKQRVYPGTFLAKWMIRTTREDWLLYLYEPVARTLTRDLTARAEVNESTR